MITDEEISAAAGAYLKSVRGACGPADIYRAVARASWNAAIAEARKACMETTEDAHEASKAKDAVDYVSGFQDACTECDESLRALAVEVHGIERSPIGYWRNNVK